MTFDLHDTLGEGEGANVGGLLPFRGRMMASGGISMKDGAPKKLTFAVSGVWNASGNATFKGTPGLP